ncbi:MAG: ABC transporter ATP-binding protein [Saezia sp.]
MTQSTPAISFREISKVYPTRKGTFKALDEVSFDIHQGEFFGLLGPNGAGKTTLISILAGLTKTTLGQAQVLGHDVQADAVFARRNLGVVPQELVFDPFFSVRETLRLQLAYFGLVKNDDWIDELLANLGLSDKADMNMRQLSGGMKRRVLVAQALVHKPPVIVLDEPTAGVDVELRQTLWKFISKLNKAGHTVLLTTHYLEEAEALCGRIAMLRHGKVVALDSTSALLHSVAANVLRFKLDATLPEELSQKARVTGRIVQISVRDDLEVKEILTRLWSLGYTVEDIEVQKADLEDVFLHFMNDADEASKAKESQRVEELSV